MKKWIFFIVPVLVLCSCAKKGPETIEKKFSFANTSNTKPIGCDNEIADTGLSIIFYREMPPATNHVKSDKGKVIRE